MLPASPVELAASVSAPLLVVHGDADPYFGLEHARMLAAAAPHSELWIEAGLGHAENAMTARAAGADRRLGPPGGRGRLPP